MDKVIFIKVISINGETLTHAVIEHADGSFTSMLKSTYDEQQAEALKVVDEAAPE
jgi:hypothetical protein